MNTRRLIALYPPKWRERYGEELVALLESTPNSWRVAANVAGGAVRERWNYHPTISQLAILMFVPIGIASASAGVAALISQWIWTQYGASPDFHSHIIGELPKICYPAAITAWPIKLRWLPWIVLFRPIVAGMNTPMMERWKVRPAEIPMWAGVLLLMSTVTMTVGLAENCGYAQTRADLIEDAFLSQAAPLMMLFASSKFALRCYKERLARKPATPTDFTRLGLN